MGVSEAVMMLTARESIPLFLLSLWLCARSWVIGVSCMCVCSTDYVCVLNGSG